MKHRNATIAAIFVLVLATACGSDDDPPGSPDPGTGGDTETTADSGY